MKKSNSQFNLFRLALLVIFSAAMLSVFSAASAKGADLIRAGLYYGNNALPTANLANEVGTGYRFGFYDSADTFISLASTSCEKITICKDSNLYLSGSTYYEEKPNAAYKLVGAYHLQTAGAYTTFDEAREAASEYPFGFPAYINGTYVVRFEFYSSYENAQADAEGYANASAVGASQSCYTVVDTASGTILFEYDNGSGAFAVSPAGAERAQTWFKGLRYYGDFLYNRRNGNDITVINILPTDLYVACVLPCEFVCSGGMESLKAGAVAIRTYAKATTKHKSNGFDICTSTDCQVYRGVYTGSTASKAIDAAYATSGECLYYDGKLIQALFYAANGGATESAANTWGNPFPYLIAQKDPYEDAISFASQSWSYTVTPQQVRTLLQNLGYSCSQIVSMEVTQTTEIGNVNRIVITDETGKEITFSRDNVRLLQNLPGVTYFSRRFTIHPETSGGTSVSVNSQTSLTVSDGSESKSLTDPFVITQSGIKQVTAPVTVRTNNGLISYGGQAKQETVGGTLIGWTISGRGYGHNVGLSQWGAYAMAARDFRYDEILQFYYPGTVLG